ncbi:MAG: tetratricopeptide repeat protein [Rhodospirillales bacterium]|jgi:predicted O-linked N-acetylglucosamine transferase (SPINDLY family)|nr:tetratricopeptide repeat protein [Rhodospirillales bacterium]
MGKKTRRRRKKSAGSPRPEAAATAATAAAAEMQQALAHHQAGRLDEAERLYGEVLAAHPDNADALFYMGAAAYQTGRAERAAEFMGRAVELAPANAAYVGALGVAKTALGLADDAVACYRRALELDPAAADVHYNLGNALLERGEPAAAIASYRRAVELNPDYAEAHNNLGNALRGAGQLDEAITCLRRATEANPDYAEAFNNLGNALRERLDADGAVAALRRAVALDAHGAPLHSNLGLALQDQGDLEGAIACHRRALAIDAAHGDAHVNLGNVLAEQGSAEAAVEAYERALGLDPNNLRARWGAALTLPILYDSEDDVGRWRERWMAGLRGLCAGVGLDTVQEIDAAKRAAFGATNFYLHYQGEDDLEAQTLYGGLLGRIAAAAYPRFAKPLEKRPIAPGDKVRIGFLSSHFREHTVAKLFAPWVIDLDRDAFEVHAFYVGNKVDAETEAIRASADTFLHHPACGGALMEAIGEHCLDALVYTDIGMDPRVQVLAALHLAPVQCVAFGHPVTTGLANVDYFLSGALLEPEGAEAHYSEKLVKLAGLGLCYRAPRLSAAAPPGVSPPADGAPVFLCAQSLFKLLPRHDRIYPEIAARVGACRFWFIAHGIPELTERFRRRLAGAFAAHGLDADDYCQIVPRLGQAEFLGLNRMADVVLDSVSWSGGNTTFDAVAMDKPVVTLPGPLMRSRVSAAILAMMGIEETTAADTDDYVAIAARLATDAAWRGHIAALTRQGKSKVYEDTRPLRDLEDFLKEACGAGSG